MRDRLDGKKLSPKTWEKLRRLSKVRRDNILKSATIKSKDRHFVSAQGLSEIKGSSGAYEKWCAAHPTLHKKDRLGDRFDMVTENVRANPDGLREDEAMYTDNQPSTPQLLMGEAIQHLQGRQREVYLLTMREGKSLAEAAEVLSISKGAAQIYRQRAIKFLAAYCRAAIKAGRV